MSTTSAAISAAGEFTVAALLTTLDDAKRLNPFSLAQRWADRAAGIEVRTLAHEIDELATMAALLDRLKGWLPIHVHRALLAGGTLDQVVAATGLTAEQVTAGWRAWSDGQRDLQRRMPQLPDHTAEYDQVAAYLATQTPERTDP